MIFNATFSGWICSETSALKTGILLYFIFLQFFGVHKTEQSVSLY